MALEAIVFPEDSFSYSSIVEWGFDYQLDNLLDLEEVKSSSLENFDDTNVKTLLGEIDQEKVQIGNTRRKRRRTKSYKNQEELENQRMTHIAVERNRRKQMNEHLSVLRSLMPPSYSQRGDQASIVGGAVNFVKELEQILQTLEAQKHIKNECTNTSKMHSSPFSSFFTSPQYSSSSTQKVKADIQVMMIESHVNLKIQLQKQPKQLIKLVMGLQSYMLTTLHLNVTAASDQMVMYSFSLKVEDECRLTSVDEIAAAVYQMIVMIQYDNICS